MQRARLQRFFALVGCGLMRPLLGVVDLLLQVLHLLAEGILLLLQVGRRRRGLLGLLLLQLLLRKALGQGETEVVERLHGDYVFRGVEIRQLDLVTDVRYE